MLPISVPGQRRRQEGCRGENERVREFGGQVVVGGLGNEGDWSGLLWLAGTCRDLQALQQVVKESLDPK